MNQVTDVRDGTHESPKYVNEGFPFITSKNVKDGYINYDDIQYITKDDFDNINKRSKVDINDILMGMIGTIGNLALIRQEPDFAIKNVALIKDIGKVNYKYLYQYLQSTNTLKQLQDGLDGGTQKFVSLSRVRSLSVWSPSLKEQTVIGEFLDSFDNLITLHQRKPPIKENKSMQTKKKELLCNYFEKWIKVYKEGAVRKVTLKKYYLSLHWIKTLVPKLKLFQIDRLKYQQILNCYAENHEKQTVMDFHHHLKSTILDAVDDGMIDRDPTRKVIIKGMVPKAKKPKYLNQYELHVLLTNLDLTKGINNDWLILLIAKTGMRFSEAVALTPTDFDFAHQILSVSKTWNYKEGGGFQPTKNKSSIRKIPIDWMIVSQFSELIKNLPSDSPIFVNGKIYNSTVNDVLTRHCKKNSIPCITIHGLRHTHASLLLFAGVSIASVAKRLGHSSMNTTEKTYLHIIQELENKDVDLVMRSVSGLC